MSNASVRRAIGWALALTAAACVGPDPNDPTVAAPATVSTVPAEPGYDWPTIAPGDPDDCLAILVLGDSLASHTTWTLAGVYREHGYCADIVDGSEGGSSTLAGSAPAYEVMSEQFERLYAASDPDAVVFSFVGNLFEGQVEPAQGAYLDLVDRATAHGLPSFVTTPPVSAYYCDPDHVWSRTHQLFRTWVMSALPVLRPGDYTVVPWSEALTPGGSWATYNDSLRFPDGEFVVRHPDCVHFGTDEGTRGAAVAATEIVAATQGLWS